MAISLQEMIRAEINALKEFLASSAGYVKKSGDTMSGDLGFSNQFRLKNVISYTANYIQFADDDLILHGQTRIDVQNNNGAILMGGVDGAAGRISFNNTNVFFPVQAATASAPAYVKGGLYFDTTLNKLMVGGASAWEAITSA